MTSPAFGSSAGPLGPDLPLDEQGRSPLARLAASSGLPQGVRTLELAASLLARGADPNLRDARGSTPLMLAASRQDEAMAKLLVSAGADLDAADFRGMTPLAWSFASSPALGRRAVWRLLFELGADARFVDNDGNGLEYHYYAHGRHDPEFLALVRACSDAEDERDAIEAASAPGTSTASALRV